ncbi:hypothetical protein IMW75_03315 [Pseudomonas gregormendelii]|uniref:Methyl-accepting chemotaxis protein n=1 Tax=Pseudomonas gregormendelii TaxID=1628277 RepID=A0ABS3ADK2_9PSED|nr:hypothetical protein [Pseudomonas gregormendelii]MBN3964314.1 hypothetical protein [Pseudomonas gregormendelii]
MNGTIRAILAGAFLQILVGSGLTFYLFDHTTDMALRYAQMAERNAESYTDAAIQLHYNRMQIQFSEERESMRAYVQKTIDLKISQVRKPLTP